jgi:hypothetical protein
MIWWLIAGALALYIVNAAQGGLGIVTYTKAVTLLGQAISQEGAEGFGPPNALPTKNNNPGDLTDGMGNLLAFPSVDAGWDALYSHISGWFSGISTSYNTGLTFTQLSQIYTGSNTAPSDQEQWAQTVVDYLNANANLSLTVNNTLADYFTAMGGQ